MQGNQAIAEGAIYAGAKFFAGYPITPSSEIATECSEKLIKNGGVYIQMEDELASMAAIVGASLSGVKSLTATSGPGFSLMQENLGMAQMAEVPCVIINVQRSGPSTGLATKPAQADVMQARWGRHGDQAIITLAPSSVQECFDLTVKAFNLSEKFRTPVILLSDEVVSHMRESIVIPKKGEMPVINRKKPTVSPDQYLPFEIKKIGEVAPLAEYGSEYIFHVTSSMHGADGYSNSDPDIAKMKILHLHQKIYNNLDEIVETKQEHIDDMEMLVIAYGFTARAAREAILKAREKDMKVGLLQLISIWPFAEKEIAFLSTKANKILVPEMNLGQVIHEVKSVVGSNYPVYGLNKSNGEVIEPDEILEKIMEVY